MSQNTFLLPSRLASKGYQSVFLAPCKAVADNADGRFLLLMMWEEFLHLVNKFCVHQTHLSLLCRKARLW